ncbi:mitochondrial carrier [Lactarius deliciosus]|nr:mitochondrial carrier [Lactarius deliciosus]
MVFSITSLLLFAIFLSVFLITVPLTGSLVRLQLDSEDGVQLHTDPVMTSFFLMLSRVRSLEGWAGLMKGTDTLTVLPTLLSNALFRHFSRRILINHGIYNSPATNIGITFVYNIFLMLVPFPAMIITYRSIITPYQLPSSRPLHSLRVLLTPTERRKPWVLYLTPVPQDFSPHSLTIYLAISLFSTAIIYLLEVISTRLAVQRNHESAEFNSVAQEEYSPDEDVVGDCASRIIHKEGWRALYRG